VTGNYYERAKQYNGPASNTVTNNVEVMDSKFPQACLDIMAAAGPLPPYHNRLSHNRAFRRPVAASSEYDIGHAASMAVDGNPDTSWSPRAPGSAAWIQVDLLAPYVLSEIHILSRRDAYQRLWVADFQIWASNNADMSQGHVILGSQGPSAFPDQGVWKMMVHDTTPYRHVAVVKTTNDLTFAELRVF
jgi:hypothetical protein